MDQERHFPAEEIIATAKSRLRRNAYPAVRLVSCEWDRGRLFLRGRLPSFYQKQLAQAAVAGLPGVAQVVNQTEVVGQLT
jgi:osmotically-inducible protein OsmY